MASGRALSQWTSKRNSHAKCAASYYVTVDGQPYEQVLPEPGTPFGPHNRRVMRPLNGGPASATCATKRNNRLSVELPQGLHTIAVHACREDPDVPRTLPASRRFAVRGAPPNVPCGDIEGISDYPTNASGIEVSGVDCAAARAFVLARANDCATGSCRPDNFICESPYQGAGSLEVLCINEGQSIDWVFSGGY